MEEPKRAPRELLAAFAFLAGVLLGGGTVEIVDFGGVSSVQCEPVSDIPRPIVRPTDAP
jgi:hypothetical protein